jgi:arsenate reductase
MILYIYSKCSTCKEALSYLKELGIDVVVREITETPPSIDELNAMLHYQEDNLKKLFNTSGNLYREMQLAEKLPHMALQESLKLLSTHGMLVKRPFFLGKNFGLIGFNKANWKALSTELSRSKSP